MKFLLVGCGGREHAIAWKLIQSDLCEQLYVAPGNGGTEQLAKCSNIDIDAIDIPKLINFAQENSIDMIIPGPEAPLAMGIIDACKIAGINYFGPTQAASRLESSKVFCKQLCDTIGVPTPPYKICNTLKDALAHLQQCVFPIVLKADGLAAGKGVIIAETLDAASNAAIALFNRYSGVQPSIVIEQYIQGEEISFICICSGTEFITLASSQDHKTRDDGDTGPNTGGMGAYSPAPKLTAALQQTIENTIIKPTLQQMSEQGTPFSGFLYAGLMIDTNSKPFLLEYNCRLGDPETQPLMLRLNSDLAQLFWGLRNDNWSSPTISWDQRPALGVVLASAGYPGDIKTGLKIEGLNKTSSPETQIFQAGTKLNGNDTLTNGGRVLCVTALGDNLQDAQSKAYNIAKQIHWPGAFYRKDIGHRALELTSNQASES